MSVVLDTTIVSALMRGDSAIVTRLRATPKADVSVPYPVLAEIAYGIDRLPRSKRRQALTDRLALVAAELPRAPWTDDVSAAFGVIKAGCERRGERIEDFDAAIAAHALATGATLATTNTRHMARIPGLAAVDWTAGG